MAHAPRHVRTPLNGTLALSYTAINKHAPKGKELTHMEPVVYSGKGSYSATSMIKGMRDIAKIMNLLGINPNHFSRAEYSKALNATPKRIRTVCRCWYQLNTEEFEQYQRGFAAWVHAVNRGDIRVR